MRYILCIYSNTGGLIMVTTIQKWGNSQGIRIPKFLLDAVNWSENEEIEVRAEEDKIIIQKTEKRKNIMELFNDCEETYERVEVDWGEPTGDEIW